jgi:hypothetical protein
MNVHRPEIGRWKAGMKKLSWAVIAIFSPEWTVWVAIEQMLEAREIKMKRNKFINNSTREAAEYPTNEGQIDHSIWPLF